LSQQIKNLKRELQQPLFDRLPCGAVLTEAGQRLLEHARRVLAELHDEHCLAGQVQAYCVPHGQQSAVAARGAQLHPIAMMVSAWLGVSVLPERFRAADAAADQVYVRFAAPAPERELCMAWSLLRYRTNAARAFVEAVRAKVARQNGKARVDKLA
jgi:DNA-binding transcriptional LysR family regulator